MTTGSEIQRSPLVALDIVDVVLNKEAYVQSLARCTGISGGLHPLSAAELKAAKPTLADTVRLFSFNMFRAAARPCAVKYAVRNIRALSELGVQTAYVSSRKDADRCGILECLPNELSVTSDKLHLTNGAAKNRTCQEIGAVALIDNDLDKLRSVTLPLRFAYGVQAPRGASRINRCPSAPLRQGSDGIVYVPVWDRAAHVGRAIGNVVRRAEYTS